MQTYREVGASRQGGTFKYDPFGRRIYKSSSSGTSVYAYDKDDLIEETNGSGAVVARYTQTENLDEPLAMLRSSTTSYYQTDGLNSITSLSSTAGVLAQTYSFDSFGNQTAASGSITNSFRYTGREFDAESSLYYMRARYFDPTTGRFLTEDPIRHRGGINFYRYVRNNPINLIDPFGLGPSGAGVGGVVGGIIGGILGFGGGAAGGTLVAPGVGTVGGAIGGTIEGAAEGAVIGAALGAAIGDLIDSLSKVRPKPNCNSGRQTKCMLIGTDKVLKGCIYACDDGTLWFQSGPCPAFIYRDWGTGVPNR